MKEEGAEDEYGDEYDAEEDDGNDDGIPDDKFTVTTPNIQNFWIKLLPGPDAFCQVVIKTFQDGLSSIRCFERWSKHSDLEKYANALEEWDDLVGENWEEPEQTCLDPQTWIVDNPIQRNHEETIRNLITSAYSKANRFLERF